MEAGSLSEPLDPQLLRDNTEKFSFTSKPAEYVVLMIFDK